MPLEKLRRLVHLLLAVALVAGVVVQGVQAADMGAKMAMTSSAMSMALGCDDCSGDDNPCASSAACFMACGNVLALPVVTAAVDPRPACSEAPASVLLRTGWQAPPDPHPPRSSIPS